MGEANADKMFDVHEVYREDMAPLKCLLRRDRSSSQWVMSLLERWEEGGVEARVFTDRWPHCSCAVVFYQEWVACAGNKFDDEKLELIAVIGNHSKVVPILQQSGVIDWTKKYQFWNVFKQSIAEKIVELFCHSLGQVCPTVHIRFVPARRYTLKIPTGESGALPEGLTFQELQPSHAEFISQYWPFWMKKPRLRVSHFMHCIANDGVGVFTQTTPPQLVSWAVMGFSGAIHHLYTLPEYRGMGLAGAVVREMCRRIQAKGEEPFCYTALDNPISNNLFRRLGFTESEDGLLFLAS